jgi:uncharacterized protein GlcG (DUF336 family)
MVKLAQATTIIDAALRHARAQKLPPMTVAVLDGAGCLVAFQREDSSSLLREDIAKAKAWGALGMGIGTRSFVKRAADHPAFFNALTAISGGRIVPVPGGVLIRSSSGEIMGAAGVSGDLPDRDEACAVIGIEAAGLVADGGTA